MDTLIPILTLAGDRSTLRLGTDLSPLVPVPVHAGTVWRYWPLKDLHLSVLGLWQLLSAPSPGFSPHRILPSVGWPAGARVPQDLTQTPVLSTSAIWGMEEQQQQ